MTLRLSSFLALLLITTSSQAATMDDVRNKLTSEPITGLYSRTYNDIVSRLEPSGFYQESKTGAYSGMFSRTTFGLVCLLMETGKTDKCEPIIDVVLKAQRTNKMERIPHVLDRPAIAEEPVSTPGNIVQSKHLTMIYRLDDPSRYSAMQEFTAPGNQITAVEAFISGERCEGPLVAEIRSSPDGPALGRAEFDSSKLTTGGRWARFRFDKPVAVTQGGKYFVRIHLEGKGIPVWAGLTSSANHRYGMGYGRDLQASKEWFSAPNVVTAYAIDTGSLRHSRKEKIRIISDLDEIDGQAHLILAWAKLANQRGRTKFEDRTYRQVSILLDRTIDWPYMSPPTGVNIGTGLIHNVSFEHSREGRMWSCSDLLSQTFTASALTEMIQIAKRRGDIDHEELWRHKLAGLESSISERMTRELDGKKVYLEMRLPNSSSGVPFEGLSWVNLGPAASQWVGLDWDIMRNTVDAYRAKAMFTWNGKECLSAEWWPDKPLEKAIIGKGVGWELAYCAKQNEINRICDILDCVAAVNSTPIYMEGAFLKPDNSGWLINDPGNGEQNTWWCWGMARVRKAAGLSPAP